MPSRSATCLHDLHAAVEVGIEREHDRAVRDRLDQLRHRDLAARQEHHRRDPGRRRVGRERRRGVARRRARHRRNRLPARDHLLHHRHQHRHAEVLEGARVRVAALLDPQILDADLAAVALRPEQVRVTLVHRHDVLVVDLRAAPIPSCPTHPTRRATRCGASAPRRCASTPRRRSCAARPCRGRPGAVRRHGRCRRLRRVRSVPKGRGAIRTTRDRPVSRS